MRRGTNGPQIHVKAAFSGSKPRFCAPDWFGLEGSLSSSSSLDLT